MRKELVQVGNGKVDLKSLSLKDAWDLRDQVEELRERIDEWIDKEIKRLVKQGWTQTRIAKSVGRSQQTVSRRMERIGVEPRQPHRRRTEVTRASNFREPDDIDFDDSSWAPPPDSWSKQFDGLVQRALLIEHSLLTIEGRSERQAAIRSLRAHQKWAEKIIRELSK